MVDDSIPHRSRVIRTDAIGMLERLVGMAREYGLPEPPFRLRELSRSLVEDSCTVLVAGEAKRGKSSFVNALIGRPLLPVDVQVATSQVFHVRPAAETAFRLRFEDDSTQEIAAGDLDRYGNQAVQEIEGAIRLDRMIRWIEVDTPTRFLPDSITLLDTPGLGTLHGAHAQVTQRVIPLADAVIFVLDASQPVTHLELDLIETILDVTPHIFFIQTKIDQHRRSDWVTVQRRSQQILTDRFGERLADRRVWPISNRLLLDGAHANDDDFVLMSGQPGLAAAIEAFLFRVAGKDRVESALGAAAFYQATAAPAFAGRLRALTEQSAARHAELLADADRRRREFDARWGPSSTERLDLARVLHSTGRAGIDRFTSAIASNGPIARTLQSRIGSLVTLTDAQYMGERIGRETVAAVMAAWNDAIDDTRRRYVTLLQPFAQEAEAISWILSAEAPQVHFVREPRGLRPGWTSTLPEAPRGSDAANPFVQGTIDVLMLIGMLAPPVSIAASTLSLAWSAARNLTVSDGGRMETARTALLDHLDETLDRIHQHFLITPVYPGHASLATTTFAAMEDAIARQVQAVADRKLAEADAEIARMAQGIAERREAGSAETQRQAAAWDAIGQDIAHLLDTAGSLSSGAHTTETPPGDTP